MQVLLINSYAGSLNIAAHMTPGVHILGSYEDSAYGIEHQKANFPDVEYLNNIKDWPAQNLSETAVFAHPPCAPFSMQTAGRKEFDTEKFRCTTNILDYTMQNCARVICIESVCRAATVAQGVHEHYAKRYGYDLFRIYQNSITFGVPQWRQRFWLVYWLKGANGHALYLKHTPRYKTLADFYVGGDVAPRKQRGWEKQYRILRERYSHEMIDEMICGRWGFGPLSKIIARKERIEKREALRRLGNTWTSGTWNVLNPESYCQVVIGSSNRMINGSPVSVDMYKRLMGFPIDYKIGPADHVQTLISRGVVVDVAKWLMTEIEANWMRFGRSGGVCLEPGQLADFRVDKKELPYGELDSDEDGSEVLDNRAV